jgi:hypothetical protein
VIARYRWAMDTRTPSATTDRTQIPEVRDCTRCGGQQHLIAAHGTMGKYRCDVCELVVGFDLEAEPAEFLIDRGQPGRYTRDIFGQQLTGPERRL